MFRRNKQNETADQPVKMSVGQAQRLLNRHQRFQDHQRRFFKAWIHSPTLLIGGTMFFYMKTGTWNKVDTIYAKVGGAIVLISAALLYLAWTKVVPELLRHHRDPQSATWVTAVIAVILLALVTGLPGYLYLRGGMTRLQQHTIWGCALVAAVLLWHLTALRHKKELLLDEEEQGKKMARLQQAMQVFREDQQRKQQAEMEKRARAAGQQVPASMV